MKSSGLTAERRTVTGSAASQRLRRQGIIPGVLYGHKEETIPLALKEAEIEPVLRHGERMIDIVLDGTTQKALIKEVQYDTFGDFILHVDLTRVALDEKVEISVEITTTGTAPGVAEGGVLDVVMRELEIECLPTDMPSEIKVDVKGLNIGDSILLKDLPLPEGVTAKGEPQAVVVTVLKPEEEEEEAEDKGREKKE